MVGLDWCEQIGLLQKVNVPAIVQCGDASHDSFKGDTEMSYIETP